MRQPQLPFYHPLSISHCTSTALWSDIYTPLHCLLNEALPMPLKYSIWIQTLSTALPDSSSVKPSQDHQMHWRPTGSGARSLSKTAVEDTVPCLLCTEIHTNETGPATALVSPLTLTEIEANGKGDRELNIHSLPPFYYNNVLFCFRYSNGVISICFFIT